MTVFGPGVGECIILHVGDGDWVIIDSCVLPGAQEPVALGYLRNLNVNPADSVRRILATHWHDDHIHGLAKLLEECPKAHFAMSTALAKEEFFELVLEIRERHKYVSQTSTAHEFSEILEILERRAGSSAGRSPTMYVHDGTRIFHGGYQGAVDVWALSPSAESITNAQIGLADRLLTDSTRMFKQFGPNDLSVAVLVDAGPLSLILGADLENTKEQRFGWKAVLSSKHCPERKSNGIKLAHHGSGNGDHEGVWETKLVKHPIAFVTPYLKLKDPLPKDSDVLRIKSRTENGYCTTWPPSRKPHHRPGVDGIVGGATVSRRAQNQNIGFLRLRLDMSDVSQPPKVEAFGSAVKL